MEKKIINTNSAPAAIGPYSQAVSANGEMCFVSGQLPIDPKTGEFAGSISAGRNVVPCDAGGKRGSGNAVGSIDLGTICRDVTWKVPGFGAGKDGGCALQSGQRKSGAWQET